MADIYTHKFIFNIGEKEIKGNCELNTDGLASYEIKDISAPMPTQLLKDFTEWMDLILKMHRSSGEILNIQVKQKDLA